MCIDISSLEFYYSSVLPQPRHKHVNVLFRTDIFSLTYFRVKVFFIYIDNVSVTDTRNSLLENAYLKLEGSGKIKTKHSRHWMDNKTERQVKNIFREQREKCKYSSYSNFQPALAGGLLGVKFMKYITLLFENI